MKLPKPTECRECGSNSLTWDAHNKNVGQAQDGRLCAHEIRCQFVLGCDECSETLAVVSADQIAAWLMETREASAEPSAPVEIDERAEFENWGKTLFYVACFERDDADSYVGRGLQGAWLGWQARAALERKP